MGLIQTAQTQIHARTREAFVGDVQNHGQAVEIVQRPPPTEAHPDQLLPEPVPIEQPTRLHDEARVHFRAVGPQELPAAQPVTLIPVQFPQVTDDSSSNNKV